MADPDPAQETNVPPAADYSANAIRREPTVLESTAQDLTPPDPPMAEPTKAAAAVSDQSDASATEKSTVAPEASGTPAEPPVHRPRPPGKRSGGSIIVPGLLALLIGSIAGFGSAYLLHVQDGSPAAIDALNARLVTVERQQTDLIRRLAALETQSRSDAAVVLALRADMKKLPADTPGAGAAPDLAPLTQQVSALQGRLTGLVSQVGTLSGEVEAQKSAMATVQHAATEAAATHAGDAAVAIIAGSLLHKAETGAPFNDDLTTLATHGLDKTELAQLQPAAATGIATTGALAKQFLAETDAVLATEPAPETHGFVDRLMKDAEGLVRIRKIGDGTGDGLAAHVARIQNALDAGDAETAYQQWTSLPPAAREKSQGFGTAAKTRIDTLKAARAVEAQALAGLGKAKS